MIRKREKPSPEWPLYWHSSGYWAKTIRGSTHYFGRRGSADETDPTFDADALADYSANVVSLRAGRGRVDEADDSISVVDLCEAFLVSRHKRFENGEIAERTWNDYRRIAQIVADHFGEAKVGTLRPADFEAFRSDLAEGRSVVTLANLVRISRIVFRHAKLGGFLPDFPDFGGAFAEPSRQILRRDRNQQRREHGLKMFEAREIRLILENKETPSQLKAMTLLGINCAYGNRDCSDLLRPQVVTRDGRSWLEVERMKTQVERRCPLWPETVEALRVVNETRPDPVSRKYRDRVFLTKGGAPWVRGTNNELAKMFGQLLEKIETGRDEKNRPEFLKRRGLSFYALRHTAETIGDEARDKTALNLILGHVDSSMSAVYRERIADERLVAVTEYVREWLFNDD